MINNNLETHAEHRRHGLRLRRLRTLSESPHQLQSWQCCKKEKIESSLEVIISQASGAYGWPTVYRPYKYKNLLSVVDEMLTNNPSQLTEDFSPGAGARIPDLK